MIGYWDCISQESTSRSRKSRTSSTFSVSKKAAEPKQKSLVQRYFDASVHALTKSARAFCAPVTKSVVWKPTFKDGFMKWSREHAQNRSAILLRVTVFQLKNIFLFRFLLPERDKWKPPYIFTFTIAKMAINGGSFNFFW